MAYGCWFRAERAQKPTFYHASDLQSYRLRDGKYYVSKAIVKNNAREAVFLEYLVNGKADLYYYKDRNGDHFFIQNENDSLLELSNTEVELSVNGQRYMRNQKEYIETFKTAFQDCPEIQPHLEDLPYNYRSLISFTKEYHDYVCTGYECVTYNKDIKPLISLGYTAGVVYTDIEFDVKDYTYEFLENEVFQFTPSFATGFLFSRGNIFGLSDNFSFNINPGLAQSNYKSANIGISLQTITVPLYFTYVFPTGNVRPFLNFGLSNTFILHSSFDVASERFRGKLEEASGYYQLGGLLGAGVEYKKNKLTYALFSNYEVCSGITKARNFTNNYLSSRTQGFGINLGIKYDLKN